MYPSSFAYHRAESVSDAISRLTANPDAKILAGGHSLIPAMKLRLAMPGEIVDISKLQELQSIVVDDDIRIGAGVTYREIADHPEVSSTLPILPMAIKEVGDMQVRARGTLGGSIAHADPAADLTAVFLALDGRARLVSAEGERIVSADEFFVDLWTTTMDPTEVLTEVLFPRPAHGARMSYAKHRHPASGYAVVGIAVVLTLDDVTVRNARVVVTGATSKPERLSAVESALTGNRLEAGIIEQAAVHAAEGVEINGDAYADTEYRAQLMRVMTHKALESAAGR